MSKNLDQLSFGVRNVDVNGKDVMIIDWSMRGGSGHAPANKVEIELITRVEALESCIREMQQSITGGQIANPQEIADTLRAIALRYGVTMGDEA